MILPETDVKCLLFQRVSAIIYGFFNSISLAEMCEKRIAVKNLIEDHTMDKDAFKTQIQELLKAEALDAGAICKLIHEQLASDAKEAIRAFVALTEAVVAHTDLPGAVACMHFYATHHEQLREITLEQMREVIRRSAAAASDKLLVDAIGLNTAIATAIVRRLSVLTALRPGTYVNSQSWGFGQVQAIDELYSKVIIDFDGKKGHAMSLSVAGQNLTIASEDHLMVRYIKDPDAIKALAEKHPGELVRLTIQSYGEMSVVRLAERLAELKLVDAANWKKFWEAARRSLKADKAHPVEIPAKRTAPIRLLEAEEDYGDKWLARFAKERDIKTIYDSVLALLLAKRNTLPDSYLSTVSERLRFALKGAELTDYPRYAQVAILMRSLGLSTQEEQQEQIASILEQDEQDNLLLTMHGLSGRDVAALTTFILEVTPENKRLLLDHLSLFYSPTLTAVLTTLKGDAETGDAVRLLLARQAAPLPTLVVWALRNLDANPEWRLPTIYELVSQAIHVVEQRLSGENLKMRNVLQGFFDNARWLEELCGKLSAFERQVIFERIQASSIWEPSSQRNILVRMARFDSALTKHRRQVKAQVEQKHITSQRSLTALKLAYEYLVNTEIPKNTHDIATARSYGDLRENAEYQFAKEQQRMLLARQDEMLRRLNQLTVADFANVTCETVVPGTRVTITGATIGTKTYTILGEMDSDEALSIISCRTRLAATLLGKKAGDIIENFPAEKGTITVKLAAVDPIDDAVRAWLADIPTTHTPSV